MPGPELEPQRLTPGPKLEPQRLTLGPEPRKRACEDCDRNSKDLVGRNWIGDNLKFFPREEDNLKSKICEPPKGGIVRTAPYTTARFERSTDFFTVKAGSFTLLRNFSASILVDSLNQTKLVKEFCINVEGNQKLNLTFIPLSTSSGNFYAFINAIEIVSMPQHLYYSPSDDKEVPQYVSQSPQFYINYSMALEMVFRLNVGGSLISPTEDTGLFREWSPDINYFKGAGVVPHNASLIPKFSIISNCTAPDDVYRSARSMGPNNTKNLQSNLAWGLPVDSGFNYLVRLHFCELIINKIFGQRRFIIYIDYQLAEEDVDVLWWTKSVDTPYYKDYVVMIRNKGVEDKVKHILSIDLHPRPNNLIFDDAILNGVEIFKLSNPDGNLGGPNSELVPSLPASKANESKTKKTILIAIGSGVGFLVVLTSVCCMVLLNKGRPIVMVLTIHYQSIGAGVIHIKEGQQGLRPLHCPINYAANSH
ncbi:receptor-like protein kinase FERONIA [Fagus crenata]